MIEIIIVILLAFVAILLLVIFQRRQAETMRRNMLSEFEALSAKMLKESTSGLKESNREQLEAVLTPLKENIENFRNAVNEAYKNDNASRESLSQQINRLMELNHTIGLEAKNLTTALKSNPKVQGNWGEMVLETLLENAGLEKGINFDVQLTRDSSGHVLKQDDGRMARPDVVIYLPDGHKLIVDSKTSLTAYMNYIEADDESSRKMHGELHLRSVKSHIDELSNADYQKVVDGSADYVMMFIPNEGAYLAALQLDAALWQYAYDRRVVIVSPTHLFSVMSVVSQLWRQDKQNKFALEIADRGGKLYDKAVLFVEEFEKIGDSIHRLQTSFDTAKSRLQGRGSIISQAETLKKMGVKATKSMPQKAVDAAAAEDELLIEDNDR